MADLDDVRILISDEDPSNYVLTDEQITALLTLEGAVHLAAARALETIAISETLISKVIKTQELSTNGPAVAASLREAARQLREDGDGGMFEIIDYDPYPVSE